VIGLPRLQLGVRTVTWLRRGAWRTYSATVASGTRAPAMIMIASV
jgi:hypothetical protein